MAPLSLVEMDLGLPTLEKFSAIFAVIAATGFHDKAGDGNWTLTSVEMSLANSFFFLKGALIAAFSPFTLKIVIYI